MTQRFTFIVTVDVEHQEGKFVSRAEIADSLKRTLEAAQDDVLLNSIGPDRGSTYDATSWDVAAVRPLER